MGARPLPAGPLNHLLQPSLADHVPRAEGDEKPWRVGSQIYVAILGGPVAVTAIALLNARRLRLPTRTTASVAAIGVLATVLSFAVIVVVAEEARLAGQIIGAAAAGAFYLLMRSHDRAYFAFAGNDVDEEEAYASLWGPGTAAVVGGMVVTVAVAGLLA